MCKKEKVKKYENIVALILLDPSSHVFIGKHAAENHKLKWGIPSTRKDAEARPQDTAIKLLEVCSFGLLTSKKECVYVGKTIHGITVYKVNTSQDFDSTISLISKYLTKCFPKDGVPIGLLPWKKCKCMSLPISSLPLDEITLETLQYFSSL